MMTGIPEEIKHGNEVRSFGVPNGEVDGMEHDYISEPDIVNGDPFESGVENPDRIDDQFPPLNPASEVNSVFHVESDDEEDEDEYEYGSVLGVDVEVPMDDDPSIAREMEIPDSLEDLDDSVVVTGEFVGGDPNGLGEYDFREDKEEELDYRTALQFNSEDGAFTGYDYNSDSDDDSDMS